MLCRPLVHAAMGIRFVYTLSDTERQHLFGWGTDIFGAAAYNLQWRPKDWHEPGETDCEVVQAGFCVYSITSANR